jgi:hypothetical protein
MNTAVTRATRPDSRGLLLKTAVVGPDVIISSLIWLVIIAALPPAVGFGVTAASLAVAAVLAVGLGENTAVPILHGARRLTPAETIRLAVPWRMVTSRVDTERVHLRKVTHGPPVSTAGRRHVLLAQDIVDACHAGSITDGEVAALITYGIGRLHHGHTRLELLWVFWTAPWDFIRGLFAGIGGHLAWVPLGPIAWQARLIVGAIAVILETRAGRWPSPIIIVTFIALSYLMPYWRRSWEQHLTKQLTATPPTTGLRKIRSLVPPTPAVNGQPRRLN